MDAKWNNDEMWFKEMMDKPKEELVSLLKSVIEESKKHKQNYEIMLNNLKIMAEIKEIENHPNNLFSLDRQKQHQRDFGGF